MPLVEIEIIGEMTVPEPGLPSILADELGLLFGSATGGTWVRLRKLPKSHYAENGVVHPLGADAIFVKITHRKLPGIESLKVEARSISEIIAKACERRTEQVHVIYEPSGIGRIAFGGNLVC